MQTIAVKESKLPVNTQKQTLEKVGRLARPILDELGLRLVGVRFTQQGGRRILEVTIHNPGGRVSLDDCEHVSRTLDPLLEGPDGEPVVAGQYKLEVQSPGIDRKLKKGELDVFTGEKVVLTLKSPDPAFGAELIGLLSEHSDGKLVIGDPVSLPSRKGRRKKKAKKATISQTSPARLEIVLADVAQIRLYPDI